MNSTEKKAFLTVKDHSVSKETFQLLKDERLDLLYTFPKPEGEKLAAYYESDDYISHTDGKRSLFEKVYQFIKKIALKNKLNLVNTLQPSKGRLLDIGAGTGDFLSVAKENGWNVSAIEPSTKARSIAEAKGIQFSNGTEDFENGSFDAITMWHVLEHVPDPSAQLLELNRLLKPNGVIIIAVPNFKSHDAELYGEFWAAYDVPRHLWHFSKSAIAKLSENAGLKLVDTRPMPFDAFYVSLLSEKYRSGAMNPIKAFLNGLKSNNKAKKTGEYSSLIYIIKKA
ncbi:class I SAM-dependent methyltransferase [Flavobacterium sp. MAH-1]|uniref:Class I SAM-dependent methyltransferase n=1 Tax=Flavobacterium agri TaxID=2743471 RepID=A0A7Y8Y1I3_9FLAO|nr:class I SAM-dependent methyltransferase [Flavobacterium agri]NUY80098.1 class I SAM-dependent methyltransferase [Flavobacterium agri]NYA70123.1 class I SAM-dependent methyltransferase [Flavobacterium agri]